MKLLRAKARARELFTWVCVVALYRGRAHDEFSLTNLTLGHMRALLSIESSWFTGGARRISISTKSALILTAMETIHRQFTDIGWKGA
jgi:hypothetical protein